MGERQRKQLGISDPGDQRRTVAEDTRGPGKRALGAEVTLPASSFPQQLERSVARWADPKGETKEVTVVGSSPTQEGSIVVTLSDLIEIGVRLRYRSGGITRLDEWVWNPGGWRRTIMASELEVLAVRIPSNLDTGQADITVGAGLADVAGVQDGTVLTIRDGVPEGGQGGFAQRVARFPSGTHEIRLWQNPSAGSFELGFDQRAGFQTFITGLGLSELEDWHSIGTANAIRYADTGSDTGSLAWLYCRG